MLAASHRVSTFDRATEYASDIQSFGRYMQDGPREITVYDLEICTAIAG